MRHRGDNRGTRSLTSILNEVMRVRRWQHRLAEEEALRLWPRIAGVDIAQHTAAVSVRAGVLLVAVSNGSWAAQLNFFRADLLRRLHANGHSHVRSIVFRVGLPEGQPQHVIAAVPPYQPSPADHERAMEVSAAAGDMAQAMRDFYLTALSRRRRLHPDGPPAS